MFDSITSARPHIQAGKLRALAVTTKQRSASLPDVPTVAEAGVPGYEVSPWFATFMPAGTPAAIVEKLSLALNESMRDPEVKSVWMRSVPSRWAAPRRCCARTSSRRRSAGPN